MIFRMKFKFKELIHELKHHAPFTAFATIIAILVILLIQYYFNKSISENLFEIFHPLHIIASSMVTAGIFYKYKPKILYSILIGMGGAIILGSMSDIILPWLGGNLLTLNTSFHLPLIEKPLIILSSALIGSTMGTVTRTTRMPHFIHVFLSVFASLFYLLAFSSGITLFYFIVIFFIILIAVIIPCCVSDILFPFLFLKEKIKHCYCK